MKDLCCNLSPGMNAFIQIKILNVNDLYFAHLTKISIFVFVFKSMINQTFRIL